METADVQVAKSEGCCSQEDIEDWTVAHQPMPSLLEAFPSMTSRGAQFQVEDLFPPITSSPATEMTAPEKFPFKKEEDAMECTCDNKSLVSNLPPDIAVENSNITQEEASTERAAPAQTQSGSLLTLPGLFSSPSLSKQMMVHKRLSELPFSSCSLHHTVLLEKKTGQGKEWRLHQEVCAKIRGYPVQKVR